MSRLPNSLAAIAVAMFLFVVGCDSVDDDSSRGSAALSVLMTDAPFPFDLVDEAWVTISGISAVSSEGEIELSDDRETLNLLDLTGGVTALLADEIDVPAGVYSEIRLDVEDASILLKDGQEFDVKVPSERIKILIGRLELDEDESATVVLDFKVGRSFVVQGNPDTPAGIKGFHFQPVVKAVGYVSDDDDDDQGAELQGPIEAIGEDYIEVGGTRYWITDETEFDDGSFASLVEGMIVEVEFVQDQDGRFVAREIDVVHQHDIEVREISGEVTAIDVVDGTTYLVLDDDLRVAVYVETIFEDELSSIDDIVVGESEVEIDYIVDADTGEWIALKIELEDD